MRTRHIITGLLVAVIAVGCQRENNNIPNPPDPEAGKGGKTQLRITAKRYEKQLDSCTIYLKYNALASSKDIKFDDTANVKNVNGTFMVVFDSLKQGNYYMFAKGRDLSLTPYDSLWGHGNFTVPDTAEHSYNITINVINRWDELKQ